VLVASAGLLFAGCGGGDSDLPPDVAKGRDLTVSAGCASCHGAEGQGGLAPTWQGLVGRDVTLEDGSVVTADAAYLRRAITDPAADVVPGYTLKMPENSLSADDVDVLLAYIEHVSALDES